MKKLFAAIQRWLSIPFSSAHEPVP